MTRMTEGADRWKARVSTHKFQSINVDSAHRALKELRSFARALAEQVSNLWRKLKSALGLNGLAERLAMRRRFVRRFANFQLVISSRRTLVSAAAEFCCRPQGCRLAGSESRVSTRLQRVWPKPRSAAARRASRASTAACSGHRLT